MYSVTWFKILNDITLCIPLNSKNKIFIVKLTLTILSEIVRILVML